ncbi:MAG: hypothetical protein JSU80_11410 [Deltaproteobacteria bacterium]|nr:MAG: hypothetical protein JSU80_11410 [Deltaproteobacteria bacterium]
MKQTNHLRVVIHGKNVVWSFTFLVHFYHSKSLSF